MTANAPAPNPVAQLLQSRNDAILHQAIYAAAKLGIADLLERGVHSSADLATQLSVHEEALYRTLRALSGEGIFTETSPRHFENTVLSRPLRSDVPDSVRSLFIFFGSEFYGGALHGILYSLRTGKPAREMLCGMPTFEILAKDPEIAKIFDDAMTAMSNLVGPAVATSYDFSTWQSLTDVGGGNGILLSHILRTHANLRGVLADLPHVLDRARQCGFLSGELASRASLQNCDFFQEIPDGSRAFLMKSVIHDWDDDQALKILRNCRRVVPANGALLLVELGLSEPNQPSGGNLIDVLMLVLTGGRERTPDEYRSLLARAGFRLNGVIPTSTDFVILEALPG
jgi:hypothetical protein